MTSAASSVRKESPGTLQPYSSSHLWKGWQLPENTIDLEGSPSESNQQLHWRKQYQPEDSRRVQKQEQGAHHSNLVWVCHHLAWEQHFKESTVLTSTSHLILEINTWRLCFTRHLAPQMCYFSKTQTKSFLGYRMARYQGKSLWFYLNSLQLKKQQEAAALGEPPSP